MKKIKYLPNKEEFYKLLEELEKEEERIEKIKNKILKECSGKTLPGTVIERENYIIKESEDSFEIVIKERDARAKITLALDNEIIFEDYVENIIDENDNNDDSPTLYIEFDPKKVNLKKLTEHLQIKIERN